MRKKCGSIRMCIDFRALNRLTIRENYPLPLIEDCIEYLDSNKCFSQIDLKNGFHQVPMNKNSVEFTSFVSPRGQFEFNYMPFGLKNGPSVFQRFMSEILQDLIRSKEIIVYMDDILIASKTIEAHFNHVLACFPILDDLFLRSLELLDHC